MLQQHKASQKSYIPTSKQGSAEQKATCGKSKLPHAAFKQMHWPFLVEQRQVVKTPCRQ